MTAINIIKKPDEIIVITDGAMTSELGTVQLISSKVTLLPIAPAMIAVRGPWPLAHLLGMRATCDGWSFDELARNISPLAKQIVKEAPHFADSEITIAGYSEVGQCLVTYLLPCDHRYLAHGMHPFSMHERHDEIISGPTPSAEGMRLAGFVCPQARDFDPDTHGVALVAAQRLTPEWSRGIGGFVQVSTVTKDTVSSRIVHRWAEDEIGQRIDDLSIRPAA